MTNEKLKNKVDRPIDAEELEELIERKCQGNRTHFSKAIGIDKTTIHRWLRGGVIPREVQKLIRMWELGLVETVKEKQDDE